MPDKELIRLKSKFIELDKDHDGTISVVEIKELMGKLGYKDTEKEI